MAALSATRYFGAYGISIGTAAHTKTGRPPAQRDRSGQRPTDDGLEIGIAYTVPGFGIYNCGQWLRFVSPVSLAAPNAAGNAVLFTFLKKTSHARPVLSACLRLNLKRSMSYVIAICFVFESLPEASATF